MKMHNPFLMMGLVVLLLPYFAFAETESATLNEPTRLDLFSILSEEDMVTSASKYAQDISDAPSAVSIITQVKDPDDLLIFRKFVSRRKTVSGNTAPSFAVANVTLYGQDFKGWDLSVSIYNLFDKEYGDVATSEHKQDLITQDAGTYRVKATYHF